MLCCSAFSECMSVCVVSVVRVFICIVFECICTMPTENLMHVRLCVVSLLLCSNFELLLSCLAALDALPTTDKAPTDCPSSLSFDSRDKTLCYTQRVCCYCVNDYLLIKIIEFLQVSMRDVTYSISLRAN